MKKTLLFVIFVAVHFFGFSQNYQCFQPGKLQYFIDTNHYLRGIRIDSVKAVGGAILYYPFHTPRGKYVDMVDEAAIPLSLDLNGGSWVGKKVMQLADGTFLFDNMWNDTVIIKTQAKTGDTWIFYKDTTSDYYTATFVKKDTMTIAGSKDSVKVINITARNKSGVITSDPVNNFKIILSKNHGFAQIFDLYTFPYHEPDTSYIPGIDCFLDHAGITQFRQIQLHNPTTTDIFSYNVGDIIETQEQTFFTPRTTITIDTIASKTILSPGHIQYVLKGMRQSTYFGTVPTRIDYNRDSETIGAGNTFLIDTSIMPEETGDWHSSYLAHYYPDDASFCRKGALYSIFPTGIIRDTVNVNGLCSVINNYKIGVGRTFYTYSSVSDCVTGQIIYSSISDTSCGGYIPLGVDDIALTAKDIKIFPNPASEQISIDVEKMKNGNLNISLLNLLGQKIYSAFNQQSQTTINVHNMPAGIYYLRIGNDDEGYVNKQVVIAH